MPEFLTEYFEQLPGQLDALFTLDAILQLGVFLLLFPLARFVRRRSWPVIQRLEMQAGQSPLLQKFGWLMDLFQIVRAVFLPLVIWILGQTAIKALESSGREVALLKWLVPFLALWLLQRFITVLLMVRQGSAEQAPRWRRVIRLLTVLGGLLLATGLLDDVLLSGFQLGDNKVTLQALIIGILILYFSFFLARNSRQVLSDTILPRAGIEVSLTQILATFVGYAIIIFGVVTSLSVVGIPLTTLTVVAGGLSVGVGFGMQEIISNFISGFILLFERSIGPGDIIEVEGTVGVVENIGIRSMRIKNLDNVELIVPNNSFLTNTVTNFTRGDRRIRVHICVGVSYTADPHLVKAALIEAAAKAPVLSHPAPSAQFVDFGASSLDFELLVWTDDALTVPTLCSDLRFLIWRSLNEAAIEIPFPQRDIHIRTIAPPVNEMIQTR